MLLLLLVLDDLSHLSELFSSQNNCSDVRSVATAPPLNYLASGEANYYSTFSSPPQNLDEGSYFINEGEPNTRKSRTRQQNHLMIQTSESESPNPT
jgi:hypothetical protein